MGRITREPDPGTGPLALFAAEHRRYRHAAGVSQADLGTTLNYTAQFVGMIEVAERTPSRRYSQAADHALHADGGLLNCWQLVSRMHVPSWFGPFIKVEAEATAMREWECMAVPGLLQTPDYARALARAMRPHASAEQIDREVDIRMERQQLLFRPDPPLLWVVMDENVLRRQAGGPEVMRTQYARLIELSELPHVVIQVLPLDAGMHTGQAGAFEILERDDTDSIVWVEGPDDGRFIDRADQVFECMRRYDHLRAMAISPASSMKLIASLIEEP